MANLNSVAGGGNINWGQGTGLDQWSTTTSTTTSTLPLPYFEEVRILIQEAVASRAHISIAKDQEERICELEKIVGKLLMRLEGNN